MPARSIPYLLSIITAVLLILSLVTAIAGNSTVGIPLGLIFLLFVLSATSYTIIRKYRKAYLRGKISLSLSIRNICLEITAILLAMLLAALAGRNLIGMVGQISATSKLLTVIGLALITGWAIGLFVKLISSRLIRNSSGN